MMRSLFISFLLFAAYSVSAFQFADGSSAVATPASKYIFYWGEHQCDLTEANGYKGNLSLSPGGFRQVLLHPPAIWDGKMLKRDFSFTLEGQKVNTANYAAQLGALDAALASKATAGKVLRLTGLPIDGNRSGSIEIYIAAPEEKEKPIPARGFRASSEPFLNTNFLEHVVWGKEDVTRNSDRDFFSAAEFWQTVRQQPYAEWKFSVDPQPLRAGIQLQSPEQGTFGLNANLDNDSEYRQMLDNLSNYKHLVRIGTSATLTLQTVERYEDLYKKRMVLVPDNDPRLLLRRSRHTHSLTIQWGNFITKLEGLYLSAYSNAEGITAPIDEPASRIIAVPQTDSALATLFSTRPVCLVDGEEAPGLTFRLRIADSIHQRTDAFGWPVASPGVYSGGKKSVYRWTGGNAFAPATPPPFSRTDRIELELDSFALTGYTLPPLYFTVHFLSLTNDLLVRNDFETLMKVAAEPAGAMMSELVIKKDSVEIEFKLPKEALVKISLFDERGKMVQSDTGKFAAGTNKMTLPRDKEGSGGKHYVFLNTPFGVLKQEIDLK